MKDTNVEINLKQNAIEKAIKLYLVSEGINTNGKIISINFSQTRKGEDAGVQAAVNIEDASAVQIPGYTDRDADPVQSATVHKLEAASVNVPEAKVSDAPVETGDPEVKPEVVEGAETKAEVVHPASTNLFGDD